jgi:hypothetical protein|tara:strand:- start:84 stop:668 length:585 start_codon:yes stop_codon:yes gene_type:complete
MPLRTISQFKTALGGGGVRPNLFEVRMDASNLTEFMGGVPAENLAFMCKAAALPAQNVASIDVPFRGRQFKVAGDRTIDNWTITVINDENFAIRNAMERWSQSIVDLATNQGQIAPTNYMSSADVFQYSRQKGDGESVGVLKQYRFIDIFPITVGDIALSYESGDTIEEFDVEFAVNNIEIFSPGSETNSPVTG